LWSGPVLCLGLVVGLLSAIISRGTSHAAILGCFFNFLLIAIAIDRLSQMDFF